MRIKEFYIRNYKSIKELTIPLNEYGILNNKSKVAFLVGLNETGKSTILKALSYLAFDDRYQEIDYPNDCNKEAFDKDEQIEITAKIEIDTNYIATNSSTYSLPTNLIKALHFIDPELYVLADNKEVSRSFGFEFKEIEYFKYAIEKTVKVVNSKNVETITIIDIAITNKITEEITEENAENFLTVNQTLLTKKELDDYLTKKFDTWAKYHLPKIQLWKPTSEYLINETILLSKFKENPEISIPLKNIFHIAGFSNKTEIKSTIDKAIGNQGKIEELKSKLANAINKHINKIWKDHKIKLHISVNGDNCEVHVEDKDKSYSYYQMEQRSDGFKQFVSLILTLSALNESNQLSNNIILIDEPEVHLHPSGVRDMRNEILKIGKNNFVLVSTHSHYMVDNSCSERHWIVTKEKAETIINQIGEETPIEDDNVLATAFGLNVFKELLPQNIIIVEGGDDKFFISHSLKQLKQKFFYSIKSAGGASKVPGLTTLLSNEKISAYVIFDDDKEGRDNKKAVLDKHNTSFTENNVFTIKDLVPALPQHSTIEDLMPVNFVKTFFDREMETNFTLNTNTAFIHQLKNQNAVLKDNKQKLESLKLKLSKEFCEEYNTKTKIENASLMLVTLIENLTNKIEAQ